MGRRDKDKYRKSLHQQAYDWLLPMLKFGESKKNYIKECGNTDNAIFSRDTYNTYKKHIGYFLQWMKHEHPECTSLKKAKYYTKDWLQYRTDYVNEKGEHLSAWTIQIEAKAINKLFGIHQGDELYFEPPIRKNSEIKRSRHIVEKDKHFSEAKNEEFINFCKGVGSRKDALSKLKAENLWSRDEMELEINDSACYEVKDNKVIKDIIDALKTFPDQNFFVHYKKDKGGRSRFAPIIGKNKNEIIERMINTSPDRKVWEYIPRNADVHSFRGDYAVAIYKHYARDVKNISKDEYIYINGKKKSAIYVCRGDQAGRKYDRVALIKCSKALGHNREDVVVNNYLRGVAI